MVIGNALMEVRALLLERVAFMGPQSVKGIAEGQIDVAHGRVRSQPDAQQSSVVRTSMSPSSQAR